MNKTNTFIAGLAACVALAGAAAYAANSSPMPPPSAPTSSCVESTGICERLERIEYQLQHMPTPSVSVPPSPAVIALTPPAPTMGPGSTNPLVCLNPTGALHPPRTSGVYAQGQCVFANNVAGDPYLTYPPAPNGCAGIAGGIQLGYVVGSNGVVSTEYCKVPTT